MSGQQKFDKEVDVLVVGSGAGALTSAFVARNEGADKVLVVEKSDQYGGTSAMSGGGIWIPNSYYAQKEGVQDSPDEAFKYMKDVIGDEVSDERMKCYAEQAKEMLKYLDEHSKVQFETVPYSDYYPERPGGKEGHRTHQPVPMHARAILDQFDALRPPPPQTTIAGRFTMTMKEGRMFLTQAPGYKMMAMMMALKYFLDIPARLKGPRSRRLTMGNALIGRLLWSLKNRNVPIWLNTEFKDLIKVNGEVIGAVIEKDGQPMAIRARKGVMLANGGFEHNQEMREEYLPKPTSGDWSGSQTNNTGDGIRAGIRVGAKTDLMEHAWWAPSVRVPGRPRPYVIFAERSLPGLVIVNKKGKRFQNEAAPYLESGKAFYDALSEDSPTIPAYVVFDATFRKKFPFGPILPGYTQPDAALSKKVKEILTIADSIEALAEKIGVDVEGLKETVERNNKFAKTGKDEDFGRGESYYDKYYGDQTHTPNPCIAEIEKGPFYALPIYPGDIGTKGGLMTNTSGQVLNDDGEPIVGLYACGNCAASVMGSKYPGAGSTLGPAMTFGYLAGKNMAYRLAVDEDDMDEAIEAAAGKCPVMHTGE